MQSCCSPACTLAPRCPALSGGSQAPWLLNATSPQQSGWTLLLLSFFLATISCATALQASWGGATSANPAMLEALQRAEAAGVLFVNSAGNSNVDVQSSPTYPASYALPNMLVVASVGCAFLVLAACLDRASAQLHALQSAPQSVVFTCIAREGILPSYGNRTLLLCRAPYVPKPLFRCRSTDALSTFSNFGPSIVHLAAPGEWIMSTVPGNATGYMSGTSMAGERRLHACFIVPCAEQGQQAPGNSQHGTASPPNPGKLWDFLHRCAATCPHPHPPTDHPPTH